MTIPSIRTGISTTAMPDVQASRDVRRIAIDRVGVKNVTYPIRLRTKDGGEQTTVASINMYVALPDHQKGTHMSRFLEVLNEQTCEPLTPNKIPAIARAICEKLNAEVAHFECSFTYFIRKEADIFATRSRIHLELMKRFSAAGLEFAYPTQVEYSKGG